MKFVALISGGKDSIFNIVEAVSMGHQLVCVANLHPQSKGISGRISGETDSYMYQTVGVELTPLIAECLQVPLVWKEIRGSALNQGMYYKKESNADEVEDLYELLAEVKARYPEIQAVATGAIFSNY